MRLATHLRLRWPHAWRSWCHVGARWSTGYLPDGCAISQPDVLLCFWTINLKRFMPSTTLGAMYLTTRFPTYKQVFECLERSLDASLGRPLVSWNEIGPFKGSSRSPVIAGMVPLSLAHKNHDATHEDSSPSTLDSQLRNSIKLFNAGLHVDSLSFNTCCM